MKKRLSVFLAAVMLVMGTAGCTKTGGDAAGGQPETGTKTEATQTTEGTEATEGTTVSTDEKEAPMLAEQVAAGTLPKLEDRMPIPSDIMVEPDVMSLGKYGGEITMQTNDSGRWNWGPWVEQSLFRFKQDGSGEVEPNVAKEYVVNDDATVYTIKLREGMRWSDGQPFTADDIIFYYNHMSTPALNADRSVVDQEAPEYYSVFTSKPYNCYQVEVEGVKYWAEFAKVNDYEFTVTFKAPKPTFIQDAAVDNKWMFLPKHFYINYVARKDGVTDDATFPLITEEIALANANKDFGKQWESYSTMSKDIGYYHWDYYIVPQVRSFIATKDNWNKIGETYELVRNPYFWKTDSEGRQLPYLDKIKCKVINDADQVTLLASSGEFDLFQPVEFATVASETKDTHDVIIFGTAEWSANAAMELNQTVKDLDKRALFQDKRFREALSISVDRSLLSQTLTNGMAEPGQAAVNKDMPGYDEAWVKKWTELDVDKANSLLDEITEPWDKTPNTYRKMKGTTKDVEIIVSIAEPSESGDYFSILQTSFKNIGVKLSDKVDAEFRKAMLSNDVEASFEATSCSTPAIRPDSIVPVRNVAVWYSAYGKWYEDGKTEANGGIAPTGDILELINAYDTMKAASGPDRDKVVEEMVQKIYDLHKENTWLLAFLQPLPSRSIINKKLRNVPEGVLLVDEFRSMSITRPEQFWIEE